MNIISLKFQNKLVDFDLDSFALRCLDSNVISMDLNYETISSSRRCSFLSIDIFIEGVNYNFSIQISNRLHHVNQPNQNYFSEFDWLSMEDLQTEEKQKKLFGDDSFWDSIANVVFCVLSNTRKLSTEWTQKFAQEFIDHADDINSKKIAC